MRPAVRSEGQRVGGGCRLVDARGPFRVAFRLNRWSLPHEVVDVLGEALVGDRPDMPDALVHPECAVGDEPGGLLVDLLREAQILVAAHEQHRHRDVGQDLPGVACHLRLCLDHHVAREVRVSLPEHQPTHHRAEDPGDTRHPDLRTQGPHQQGTGLAVPALAQQPGEVVVECLALFADLVPGDVDGDVAEAIGMAGGQACAGTFASASALKSASIWWVFRSAQPLLTRSLMKPGSMPGISQSASKTKRVASPSRSKRR